MNLNEKYTDVVMVGLGYIGLPTAAIIAQSGLKVTGVDINPSVVETINRGAIHIVEPGLQSLVSEQVEKKNLSASTTPVEADVFIIAVPTPFKNSSTPDLKYVEAAARSIAPYLKKGSLVILESTSPVGTTEMLYSQLKDLRNDLSFDNGDEINDPVFIAYCPERVLPGNVLHELTNNDRLIGGLTKRSSEKAKAFYELFVKGECVITNARTAEMAKLVENSFRDVNIAFANELSMICAELGIDVWELITLANRHPRVNILQPGCGVGGHCIAVDPWFIVDKSPRLSRLIKTARVVNDSKPSWVVSEIDKEIGRFLLSNPGRSLSDLTVAFYGLSFKPNIDDLRESPALEIVINASQRYKDASILVVEPHINELPKEFHHGHAALTKQCAASKADIKVVLVGHAAFKSDQTLNGEFVINFAWGN